MNWTPLTSLLQIQDIDRISTTKVVMIFKHSTQCSISDIAHRRLIAFIQKELTEESPLKIYYLDLLAHRQVSDEVARHYKVYHESPQILLIRNGECFYESSHLDISGDEILQQVNTTLTPSV